jgi:prefoldin alpha subunit
MSEEKLTPQQIQALSERFQQFQYQAESIAQQLNVLQITIRDLETALATITALKDEPAGKETLVPIGFGSFVNATLTNTDKVVIGIGAGVSVEKKIDDAKALLEKRKVELTKYQEQMNSTLEKITSEMQTIQKIAQKHQQTQQPLHAE